MTNRDVELAVLARGLDQAVTLLDSVTDDDLAAPTPCRDWTTGDLVDHLVAAPASFARVVRGEKVDWSTPPAHIGDDRAEAFRSSADELLDAWRGPGVDDAPSGPDWQTAEVAVHTYDLAVALGRSTTALDPEVAERGLAFMRANLSADRRGAAFAPEQDAPAGADPYQQIAAFAGRAVTPSR